ncbi:hypothetical protein [uncultured Kordia sp.]|uniref:hypothetical protein n=1 Tax=uncultured Kordia sp. TaxID=507699 RepID=UPI0026210FC6|nr:hypothetical protein [uncultured Kordia sp.]
MSCSKEKLQTVYVASKGKKYFHTKACKLQGNDKEAIRTSDALAANYKACKYCKPSYEKVATKKHERSFSTSKEELQTVYVASKGKKFFHTKVCKLQGNNKEPIGINDALAANYNACKYCKSSYEKVTTKKHERSLSKLKEELQTVYVASRGKKYFHTKACKLQGDNKEAIGINDAISKNYKACKFCKPISENKKDTQQLNHSIPSGNDKEKKRKYKKSSSSRKYYTVQCSGTTRKGKRCKRKVKKGSTRCYQH